MASYSPAATEWDVYVECLDSIDVAKTVMLIYPTDFLAPQISLSPSLPPPLSLSLTHTQGQWDRERQTDRDGETDKQLFDI